jgi:hypothetical protein
VTAAAVALFGEGRYPVLRGLVAAGVATLIGIVGEWALRTADGCLGPLNVGSTVCRWNSPADTWPGKVIALGQPLGPALIIAGLTAAILGVVPSPRRRRVRAETLARSSRHALLARRTTASVIITAALILVGTVTVQATIAVYTPRDTSTTESARDLWTKDTGPPVSVQTARLQLLAWARVGGVDLFSQAVAARNALVEGWDAAANAPRVDFASVYAARVPQTCGGLSALVRKAKAYFPVPVSEGQRLWAVFLERFESTYEACDASAQSPTVARASVVNTNLNRAVDAYNAFQDWAERFEVPTDPSGQ